MTTIGRTSLRYGLFIAAFCLLFLNTFNQVEAKTTIIVNDMSNIVADDGRCTLIEAIRAANTDTSSGVMTGECLAGTGADTIQLSATNYQLTTVNNTVDGANGLPSITSTIIIEGNGATIERASSAPPFRLFHIQQTGNLTLKAVTLRNGFSFVAGSLQAGGAIFNRGTLQLEGSAFVGHSVLGEAGKNGSAVGGGGGGGGSAGLGGAIFNDTTGTTTILNSTFSGNQALGGPGGRGLPSGGILSGNGGNGGGPGGSGGVFGFPGANGAFGGGGGGGSATREAGSAGGQGGYGSGGGGGGATNNGGLGGPGGLGGFAGGAGGQSATAAGAGGGGGAGLGGAIFNNGGTVTIKHATFAQNQAQGGTGGLGASGTANGRQGAGTGGAIYNHNGTLTIQNSILAENGSANCGQDGNGLISKGHNLVSDTSCREIFMATGDIINTGAQLGALQDNGGPSLSHAIALTSPARDGVKDSQFCTTRFDQRDRPRPQGNLCDIGAYELGFGTIIINSVVVGAPPPDSWEFMLNGDTFVSFEPDGGQHSAEIIDGAYTLEQVTKPGYVTSVTCTGNLNGTNLTTFDLLSGKTIECTFTTVPEPATLTVAVDTIGQLPETGWDVTLNGNDLTSITPVDETKSFEIEAGIYILQQNPKDGYDTTVNCSDKSFGENSVTFEVASGEDLSCTFTNQAEPAQLNLTKIVEGVAPTTAWEFEINNTPLTTIGPEGEVKSLEIEAGNYTLSEIVKFGFMPRGSCSNGSDGTTEVSFTVRPGEAIDCTFTATNIISEPGEDTLTILTRSNPAGITNLNFAGDLGEFTLDDGSSQTFTDLATGTYTIFERRDSLPSQFWALIFVECQYQVNSETISFFAEIEEQTDRFSATIPFERGQNLICTFHNEQANVYVEPDVKLFFPLIVQ